MNKPVHLIGVDAGTSLEPVRVVVDLLHGLCNYSNALVGHCYFLWCIFESSM